MTKTNTQVVLLRRPKGPATPDHFEVRTEQLGELEDGLVRVAVEYVSVEAGTRTMLEGEGFHSQVGIGGVVLALAVGRIVESTAPDWPVGQAVQGPLNAQTIATVSPRALTKIDGSVGELSRYLGALGLTTGITAWIGVRVVAKPSPGDVFVVSAAAGAVGSVVGQIAKRDGAHVIGIAGGREKCTHLVETLGFDAAIDYKNEDVAARLGALAPDGLNIFFDNVGGDILDIALDNMAMRAKVVICGAVSQYDNMDDVVGPSLYLRLAERQSSMEGFAVTQFPDRFAEATSDLQTWLDDGSLVVSETVLEGIERFPEVFDFMSRGGNLGKLLVKVG